MCVPILGRGISPVNSRMNCSCEMSMCISAAQVLEDLASVSLCSLGGQGLVEVLVGRSCEDPDEILSEVLA